MPEPEKTERWNLIGQKKFAWSVENTEIPPLWNSHWQKEASGSFWDLQSRLEPSLKNI